MKMILGIIAMYPLTAPCFVIGLTWGLSAIGRRLYSRNNLAVVGTCFVLAIAIWASVIHLMKKQEPATWAKPIVDSSVDRDPSNYGLKVKEWNAEWGASSPFPNILPPDAQMIGFYYRPRVMQGPGFLAARIRGKTAWIKAFRQEYEGQKASHDLAPFYWNTGIIQMKVSSDTGYYQTQYDAFISEPFPEYTTGVLVKKDNSEVIIFGTR